MMIINLYCCYDDEDDDDCCDYQGDKFDNKFHSNCGQ